jgi:hypothetical protein
MVFLRMQKEVIYCVNTDKISQLYDFFYIAGPYFGDLEIIIKASPRREAFNLIFAALRV